MFLIFLTPLNSTYRVPLMVELIEAPLSSCDQMLYKEEGN